MKKAGLIFASITLAAWLAGPCGLRDAADSVINGNRSNIYNAVASIEGALLGFVITATAILLTIDTPDSRLNPFRGSVAHSQLWDTFIHGMWALGLATAATLGALVFDTDEQPRWWASSFAIAGILVATYHVMMCVLRLEQTIRMVTRPTVRREPGE